MGTGLGGVWPKRCGCGRAWTLEDWKRLPFVARTPDHEGGVLEMRTCECKSALAVPAAAVDRPDRAG